MPSSLKHFQNFLEIFLSISQVLVAGWLLQQDNVNAFVDLVQFKLSSMYVHEGLVFERKLMTHLLYFPVKSDYHVGQPLSKNRETHNWQMPKG